jgi:hypothetical protein
MRGRPDVHLMTAEQARRFFNSVVGPIASDVPVRLEEPERSQSDMAECRLIIGSSIVSFLGSWEARSTLEKLASQSKKQHRTISNLFIG